MWQFGPIQLGMHFVEFTCLDWLEQSHQPRIAFAYLAILTS